jgi:hypothetical protein
MADYILHETPTVVVAEPLSKDAYIFFAEWIDSDDAENPLEVTTDGAKYTLPANHAGTQEFLAALRHTGMVEV